MGRRDFYEHRGGVKDEDFVLYIYDDDGEEEECIDLPTHWEVCGTCNGEGKHVNPAIDGNGISTQQFAEDPEFAEAYFDGAYDVTCAECHGRTTVRTVNFEALEPRVKKAYVQMLNDERDSYLERMAEMRMGC